MIACQDASPSAIRNESPADPAGLWTERVEADSLSAEQVGSRTVEILTVLNDVFDAFCLPGESGVLPRLETA